MDQLDSGPVELILSFLTIHDVARLDSTCQSLRDACATSVWEKQATRLANLVSDLATYNAREQVLMRRFMINQSTKLQNSVEADEFDIENATAFFVKIYSMKKHGKRPLCLWNDFIPCVSAHSGKCTLSLSGCNIQWSKLSDTDTSQAENVSLSIRSNSALESQTTRQARQMMIENAYRNMGVEILSLTIESHLRNPDVRLVYSSTGKSGQIHLEVPRNRESNSSRMYLPETRLICRCDVTRQVVLHLSTFESASMTAVPGIQSIVISDEMDVDDEERWTMTVDGDDFIEEFESNWDRQAQHKSRSNWRNTRRRRRHRR